MVDFFAAFTYSWFATTWQGGHVVVFFSKNLNENRVYFPEGRMLLFLTTDMAAVTSCANQQ